MKFLRRGYTLFSLLLPATVLPISAGENDARSPENIAVVADPLEVITISASRQATALKNTGMSLSVLGENELQLAGHQHIQQSLAAIPGTWISRGNGQEHLTALRSPVLTGAGACGAFFMAEDGISLRAPGFCNVNQLFDANTEQAGQIEVIRGPGSVLYGANAVHGMINIISPDLFADPMDYISQEVGPDDYYRSNFRVSGVGQNHAVGIYGNLSHDGGYQAQSGFEQQKANLLHQYQVDNFSAKTMLSASHINQQTAGFIRGQDAYKDDTLRRSNPNPEAFRDSQSVRLYSRLHWTLDSGSQLKVTPYLRYTRMKFLQHYLPWQPLEKNNHQSLGVKTLYSRHGENFSWHSGLDTEVTRGDLSEIQSDDFSPTIPSGSHYDYQVKSTSVSPFMDLNWLVFPELTVNAGVRYDHIRYDYDNLLSDGSACAASVVNCRFMRPSDQVRSFGHWSPRLGLVYRAKKQLTLYGELSQGFRAPHTSELFRLQAGQQSADLDTEKLNSGQFGIRGGIKKLSYDLSLYQMEKSRFIFLDTNRQYVGSGKTRHRGLELSLTYPFNKQWRLSATGTIARHKYARDLTLSNSSIKDNEIDTAPKHMANAKLNWTPTGAINWQLEWLHLGEYYLNPENTATYPGHDLFHLRGQMRLSEKFELSLRLLNLLNKDYAERADYAFGSYRYFVGHPRSLYLTLRYQLD
ncbi:TonB-dependent receptor [Thalassomonas sp. RHCl1]|uniref:TonB-dependent receptor n=1 Tax=Thalassomonas sp. RHCl1 TaxID=2995320 RepID=UPI00248C9737|nr:TonB-dependent receptor [Thalassomonas sp. RHCl1]